MTHVDDSVSKKLFERMLRRPFAPFVIHTKRGEKILVGRPNQAAANETLLIVFPIEGGATKRYKMDEVSDVVDV